MIVGAYAVSFSLRLTGSTRTADPQTVSPSFVEGIPRPRGALLRWIRASPSCVSSSRSLALLCLPCLLLLMLLSMFSSSFRVLFCSSLACFSRFSLLYLSFSLDIFVSFLHLPCKPTAILDIFLCSSSSFSRCHFLPARSSFARPFSFSLPCFSALACFWSF